MIFEMKEIYKCFMFPRPLVKKHTSVHSAKSRDEEECSWLFEDQYQKQSLLEELGFGDNNDRRVTSRMEGTQKSQDYYQRWVTLERSKNQRWAPHVMNENL